MSSDDEDEHADGEVKIFNDFLVVCQTKGETRPEVFRYKKGTGVNWQDKLTVKGQSTVYDSIAVCDATVDLSCAVIDLTRKSITAQARWFNELVTDLAEQTKASIRTSVVKVNFDSSKSSTA